MHSGVLTQTLIFRKMSNKLFIALYVIIGSSLSSSCLATTYTVGDSSGWDISTDLDSWSRTKRFIVGDVLLFQYSQSHTVSKVTKENYDSCNTTNVIQTSSTGNTTFPLTDPGDAYFVCGNKLHCLGGMKLHVYADVNQAAAPAPEPFAGGAMPPGDSGSDDPKSNSGSAMFKGKIGRDYMVMLLRFSFVLYFV